MKASLLYRITAVILVLFALGHTLGFSQSDPKWGIDSLLGAMRTTRFDADGFHRTYWDFYIALGYSVGLFLLFSAVLAWQLGGLPAAMLARLRLVTWALPVCFVALTAVSAMHLFLIPIGFAAVVTICLALAAWLATREAGGA